MKNELSIEVKTYAEQAQSKLQELIKDVKNLSNNVGDSSNKINNYSKKINTSFKLTGVYVAARKVTKTLLGFIDATNNYSESLNLFNVVMGNTGDAFSEVGKQATVFQNKMAENFGTQRAQTLTYQALYQSMAENMGIASDQAEIMSENTTKLINDLSSLYNKSESTTAEALRAGVFAGQTKPLRAFGLDVTEKSLTPVLDSIGITDRTVRELSQAEKQILRYIAVLRQSSIAHGDWANTIESPSNQLRIFKNQLVETSTALGGLFQGAFAKILPYANAILMVVKEVANALADMFGIEIEDYNSGIASTEEYYEDLEDGIDGATDATKKLKRETLSFDQIHNIDDKDTSGGVGSLSGGIDQRLLDAINGYDNGLDRVKMKATEIRDNIMEWLGFTKEIDPITGKVSFKYQGMKTTLKNMWNSFKGLSTQGKILVGLGLVAGATKLWNTGKKLVTTFGSSGLGQALKNLLTPTKNLLSWAKLGVQTNKSLTSGLKEGIQSWRQAEGIISSTTGKLDGFKGALNGAKDILKGLAINVTGLTILQTSLDDVANSGWNLYNTLGTVAGGVTTIIGGVQVGAVFGPWGAAIGGVVGAFEVLYKTMETVTQKSDPLKEKIEEQKSVVDEAYQSYINFRNELNNSFEQTDVEFGYYERLKEELNNIIDANGTIKRGYEERAQAIINELNEALGLNIQIVDGHVQKWNEVSGAIDNAIEKEKAYAKLEVLKTAAQNAYGEIEKAQNKVTEATDLYNESIDELTSKLEEMHSKEEGWSLATDTLKGMAEMYGITNEELIKYYTTGEKATSIQNALNDAYESNTRNLEVIGNYIKDNVAHVKEQSDTLAEAKATLDGYNETIMNWEYATELATKGNYEALNTFFDHERNLRGKNLEEQKAYWEEIKTNSQKSLEYINSNQETYGAQEYEYLKQKYEDEITLADKSLQEINDRNLQSLIEQSKSVEQLTPEIVGKWQELATKNHNVFLEEMAKLTPEVQAELLNVKDLAEGDLKEDMITTFGELAKADKNKFIEMISLMPEETKQALSSKMASAGYEIGGLFESNIEKSAEQLDVTSSVENAIEKTKSSANNGSLWNKIGSLASGIWSGITTSLSIQAKSGTGLAGFANNLITSLKSKLGIHSPSKLVINAKIGDYLFQGIEKGMENELPHIQSTALSLVDTIKGTVYDGMDSLNLEMAKLPNISTDMTSAFNTQSINELDLSPIERATYNGIARAISDYGLVQVDVNSTYQDGMITDVVVNNVKETIRRTGYNPFEEGV